MPQSVHGGRISGALARRPRQAHASRARVCMTSRSAPPASCIAPCRSTASASSRWTRPRSCRPVRWSSTGSRRRRSPRLARDRDPRETTSTSSTRWPARTERPAASLSEATGAGELDRSLRHRELRQPNGFGDELRAALVGDAATWGGLTLLRASDSGPLRPAPAHRGRRRVRGALRRRGAAAGDPASRRSPPRGRRPRGARTASCCSPATTRSRWRTPPPSGGSPSCARAAGRASTSRRWWSPSRAARAAWPRAARPRVRHRPRPRPHGRRAVVAGARIGCSATNAAAPTAVILEPARSPRARAADRGCLRPDRARAGRDPARRAGAARRARSASACTSRRGRCRTISSRSSRRSG